MADLSSFQMVEMAIYNSAGLAGSFAPLNNSTSYTIFTGNGFPDDIKILKVYNGSNVGITISIDGVTNQDFWPSGMTLIVDLQTNHADNASDGAGTLNGRKGMVIYGKGAAGVGNVYISGFR